jgi:hypothetical protein
VAAAPPTLVFRRPMPAPERPTMARRPGVVPLCAACAALLAVAGVLFGCLNPMPDDFPSERDTEESAPGAGGSSAVVGGGPTDEDQPEQNNPQYPEPAAPADPGAPDAGAPLADDAGAGDAGCSPGVAP